MNCRVFCENVDHVHEITPVVAACLPDYYLNVFCELVEEMLSHVEVHEVAEMVVHVDAGVDFYEDYVFFDGLVDFYFFAGKREKKKQKK